MGKCPCPDKKPCINFKIFIYIIIAFLVFRYIYQNSSLFYRQRIFTLPFSLHLNAGDLVLEKGESFQLRVFCINKRVSFYSTNFRVAGVGLNGKVYAYRTGKAFIIAKVNKKELKCRIRVIDLNKRKLVLEKGDQYQLKVKGITALTKWKSSNSKIASVSNFGKVKAKSKGKAIITAKVKGKVLKCEIIVK